MQKSPKPKNSRIERSCVYLLPGTHKRLNMLKAELSLESGRFMPLDEAVNVLLNQFEATTQVQHSDN